MTMPNAGRAEDAAIPPCPHFGVCGGCQLQHQAYASQLERKAAKLRALLGDFELPKLAVHASPPLGYRNRIRLTLAEVDGQLRAGYLCREAVIPTEARYEEDDAAEGFPHSDSSAVHFVPVTQCPIAAPLLWRSAEAFLALAENAVWLQTPQLKPDQLEIFTTAGESRLQLTLSLRTALKNPPARVAADFAALCESLRVQIPELAGAGIAFLSPHGRSRRMEQPRPGPVWGAPGLNYTVKLAGEQAATAGEQSLNYWVPRGAFFQANRFLLSELVALVSRVAVSSARKDACAWDLYAGVGLFSRGIASSFAEVTAVEIAEPAATALGQTKIPNLRAVNATTFDFLRTAVLQRERPSLIVLDPPRTGLGAEVCDLLARVAGEILVYVSCSPQALAADLALLTASGYSVGELHLFDLFPQTEHIETVAMLRRSS